MARISTIDSLRGLAIIIMFIDHIALFLFNIDIEFLGVRFFTRIAEPMFAIIFGFLLFDRSYDRVVNRLKEIVIVALVLNIILFSFSSKYEILVCFAIFQIIYILFGNFSKYLSFLIIFYSYDFTRSFLDYPLSIFIFQASAGMLLKDLLSFSKKTTYLHLLISVCLAMISSVFIVNENSYKWTVFYSIIFLGIFYIINNQKIIIRNRLLEEIGKRPLESYIVQYVIVIFLNILFH